MPYSKYEILLAEDDEIDVELMLRAFRDAGLANPIRVVRDGQAAIEYLNGLEDAPNDQAPALVLLDIKMPRKDGLEVLQWIRARLMLNGIPVIMFSSSGLARDVEPAYAHGASIYIVKPAGTQERADIARFLGDWLKIGESPLAVRSGMRHAHTFHQAWREFRPGQE